MRFIKKHKCKLLTLMLSIVSIFTLFLGINKTYAYESDTFSYTMTLYTDNTYSTEWQPSTNYGYDNSIDIWNNDYIYFNLKEYNSSININRFYILVNYYLINRNTGVILNSNNNLTFQIMPYGYNVYTIPRNNTKENDMYTGIMQYSVSNSITYQPNYASFHIFLPSGLDSNTSMIIKNIDLVQSSDIGLSQYYETYYGQIENNYNQLLSDYNTLQDNYDTLETNYNTLNDDYEDLQDNYNQLNGNINNLNDFYKYGFLSLIQNGYTENNNVYGSFLEITYTNRTTNVVNFVDYPITLNDISNYFGNTTFSLYDLTNHYIDVYDSDINSNDEYYVDRVDLTLHFQSLYGIDYLDFTNYDFNYDMEFFIRDDVNNYSLFLNDLDDTNSHINSTLILSKNSNLKMFNVISFGKIVYNSDFLKPYISLNNVATSYYQSGFDNGYQSGLQQGKDSQQNTINDLNNQIIILNSRVANLEHLNEALNEQINSFNSDYNLNNLMWTIASTPFDSFKQIWNVNFFGVNISSVITGFLTGIIVLWIIKKFFL